MPYTLDPPMVMAVPTMQAVPLFNIYLDKLLILTSGIWIILYISCL
jgi:hypothetical protein